MSTKIEWTEKTWNPITGCTKVSPGCANCYAERMAKRLAGRYGYPADEPFQVTPHLDQFYKPLRWKRPCRVFVCSMSDLFHDAIDPYHRGSIWMIMEKTNQHTFQVLTKRAKNMARVVNDYHARLHGVRDAAPNIWLGVTAEDQQRVDERIPLLLQTPAAVRFVSVEPMLGPVDLRRLFVYQELLPTPEGKERSAYWANLDWVIIGCESGPRRRPMDLAWARDLVGQCREAEVPVFVKQIEVDGRVSRDPAEWPEDLRVREYPG